MCECTCAKHAAGVCMCDLSSGHNLTVFTMCGLVILTSERLCVCVRLRVSRQDGALDPRTVAGTGCKRDPDLVWTLQVTNK